MPSSVQAVLVAFFAVLPGALYVWGLERHIGKWALSSPDRLLRFISASAVFHVLFAPLTFEVWDRYLDGRDWSATDRLPTGLWVGLAVYLVVPFVAGNVIGARAAGRALDAGAILSPQVDPPRAWDFFFSQHPDGWIRLKLKSGCWIGGAYASGSYSSGFPEPGDLYLDTTVEVHPYTGEFVFDEDGGVTTRPEKLLVRWDEIEFLEFIDG